ncbi:MAG: hypothetical protein HYT87_10350 [Nitrospirae bacterium]|nr:hypothetical protein [Nitrospirota bacterium]
MTVEEIQTLQRELQARRITRDELKREVRRLLFKHHPDRNAGDRLAAESRTRTILEWYRKAALSPESVFDSGIRHDSYSPPPEPEVRATEHQFVLFMVDGEPFACEVGWVLGVRNVRDMKKSDGSLPRWIHDRIGIFSLDASRRSSASASPLETAQILLLKVDRSLKGFVVDRVDGVSTVAASQILTQDGMRTFPAPQGSVTVVSPAFFGL